MNRPDPQPQYDAFRGNLFGTAEPDVPAGLANEADALSNDLSEEALGADSIARPRKRQVSANKRSSKQAEISDTHPKNSEERTWTHHSELDALQLTPMLRHYVELKTAHPKRVLLYHPGRLLRVLLRRRHRTLPRRGTHPHRQGGRQGRRREYR